MWCWLLWLLRGAWGAPAAELLERAEQAFAEGDLTTASAAAEEAMALGDPELAASAARLLVETAVRQGTAERAWAHLSAYFRWMPADEADRAWGERVSLRIQVDLAEQRGELDQAEALLRSLHAAGPLGVLEARWADWARVRLDIRGAELSGQGARALEQIAAVSAWPGSPEERWLAFAQARVEVLLAEERCDLAAAARAAGSLPPPFTAQEQAWQAYTAARLALRQAVLQGDLPRAEQGVQALRASPGLTPRERAWAEGFAAWLEREQLRLAGAEIPEELTERVMTWRVLFAEQGACEPEGRRASRHAPRGAGASGPPRLVEPGAPPGAQGRAVVGVGTLVWRDDPTLVPKEVARVEASGPGLPLAFSGLLAGSLSPVRVGTARLGVRASARGALLADPSMYWAGAVALGPELAWERLRLGAWAGGWTLSVPGTAPLTRVATGEEVLWCASAGAALPFCTEVGAAGDPVFRRLVLARLAGGAVAWRPVPTLELGLQVGAGPGPRVEALYYAPQPYAWALAPELVWHTPWEPLVVVGAGYGVGAGPGAMLEVGGLVGVGVGR